MQIVLLKIAADYKVRPARLEQFFGNFSVLYELFLDYWRTPMGSEVGGAWETLLSMTWNANYAQAENGKPNTATLWNANRDVWASRLKDPIDRVIERDEDILDVGKQVQKQLDARKQARQATFWALYRASKDKGIEVQPEWLAKYLLRSPYR